MTALDQELFYFNEIRNKYGPIEGVHLVLDLDAYKLGKEIIKQFTFDSEDYHQLINIDFYEKKLEQVIITSNMGGSFLYHSKLLIMGYDYTKQYVDLFEDLTPSPYKLKRTMQQQMKLLVFELNHPKPRKPAC